MNGGEENVILPGESNGNYNESWLKTFDLEFLIGWLVLFIVLYLYTIFFDSSLFFEKVFFLKSFIKISIMMITALIGGILCRRFCEVDSKGYIQTGKTSWFKVNYTRKIQHFAAYLVLLLSPPLAPLV